MRLDDATKKMSKSDKTSNKGIIYINDSPDMINKKIMKAKTDSDGKVLTFS